MGDPRFLLLLFIAAAVVVAAVFWPRLGLLARAARAYRVTERVRAEDVLKFLLHRESAGQPLEARAIGPAFGMAPRRVDRALALLVALGLIERVGGGPIVLTRAGREHAVHLVRAHRLWERYLADRTGVGPEEWHEEAELVEHRLSPAETERLAQRMGQPRFDPHGDPIPRADGVLPALEGGPLSELAAGRTAEVVHVEDEPRETFERLRMAGLAPGQRLTVTEHDEAGVTFVAGGHRSRLSNEDSSNVTVREAPEGPAEALHPTLADVEPGATARVLYISPACQGRQRRRLLDLGLVPDTEVTAELASPLGDPVAYRVRGALIALRRHQAEWILVERLREGSATPRPASRN